MLPWILEQALTIFVLFTCIRCSFVITSEAASNSVAAAPVKRLYRRAPIPNNGVNVPQPVPIINEESCPILSSQKLPIVLVSTIDGSIHCINKNTGNLLWSQKGFLEPLVTSHYSKPPTVDLDNIDDSLLESDEQLMAKTGFIPETLFMTEPAKQGLIYFLHQKDGKGIIQKSKASFKDLIEKAPLTWNNRIYLGSKKTHYFALDHHTGEIVEEFDENNYMTYRSGKPKGLKDPLLMIGRIDYQLKIHDYDSKHLM
jgi:serine/threonine-protein kinase/endoribonuclease IRE1